MVSEHAKTLILDKQKKDRGRPEKQNPEKEAWRRITRRTTSTRVITQKT